MFQYYEYSVVCYAYLADVKRLEDLEKSRWFTRGWTLQELLAPRVLHFYDGTRRMIGTKQKLSSRLSSTTGIPEDVLLGKPPQACNAAQRMSWASRRQTTREEDIAYCLLGLFDIHMAPIYGEGAERAFLRIQEEILHQSADHTLFIWTPNHEPYNQGLLATSPRAFCTHPKCFTWLKMELREQQNSFDPYAYLRRTRNSTSRQLFTVDETTGRTGMIPTDGSDLPPILATLGPSGLQTSILCHIKDESQLSQGLGTEKLIINFDLLADGTDSGDSIYLVLVKEIEFPFEGDFTPNRMGMWRREISTHGLASYSIEAGGLSFERKLITISQINTPTPYSGPLVRFALSGPQSEALVSQVFLMEPSGDLKRVSSPQDPFMCRGGIVVLQHSCTVCEPQYKTALSVGGSGTIYRPWCYTGTIKIPVENESSISDMGQAYKSLDYRSARFGTESKTFIRRCNTYLGGRVHFGADEGLFFISLTSVQKQIYSVRQK
jgi:hypothetical protein